MANKLTNFLGLSFETDVLSLGAKKRLLNPETPAVKRMALPPLPGLSPKEPSAGLRQKQSGLLTSFETPKTFQPSRPTADAPAFGFVDPAAQGKHLFQVAYVKPKDNTPKEKTNAAFKTILNLPPTVVQEYFTNPVSRLVLTGMEAYRGKPEGIKIESPSVLFGDKKQTIQGIQSSYNDQIQAGVLPKDAFINSAIQLGIDLSIVVPMAHGIAKASVLKFSPESLLKEIDISRNTVSDILADRPVPEGVYNAFRELSPEMKVLAAKGLLLRAPTSQPSLLGKIFGLSPEDARILYDQAVALRQPAPVDAPQLPGYRPVPGTEPKFKFGLSIQETERVGGEIPKKPPQVPEVVKPKANLAELRTAFEKAPVGSGEKIRLGKELTEFSPETINTEIARLKDDIVKGVNEDNRQLLQGQINKLEDVFYTKFRNPYIEKKIEAEEALGNIIEEMSVAEAGERIMVPETGLGQGSGYQFYSKSSSFPKWVPEELRTKKLFDKVLGGFGGSVDELTIPSEKSPKQRALFNVIMDELDSRIGTDTAKIRESIIQQYDTGKKEGIAESIGRGPSRGKGGVRAANRELAAEISDSLDQNIDTAKELNLLDKADDAYRRELIKAAEDINKPATKRQTLFNVPRPGKPKPKMITRAEDVLLRKQIRDEARGSRAGLTEGKRLTKEQLVAKFKDSRVQMAQLKSLVAEFISDVLPPVARGKFLQAFIKDINRRKAFSLFKRASILAENIEKAKLIGEIKELKIPRKGDEGIAIDYQKKLIELFRDLDFQKPSQETVNRLKSLSQYLEKNKEALDLHPELLEQVARLSKKNLRDMNLGDLKELKKIAERLTSLGKLKRELKNKYNARIREANLKKLTDSTVNRDVKIKDRANPTYRERRSLEATRSYVMTLHTPRVADWLDGFNGYKGENAKLVKKLIRAELSAKDISSGIMGEAVDEITALGIGEITEEMQRNITLNLLQSQGANEQVQTLLGKFNLKEVPELSQIEKSIADIMRKHAGQYTNEVATVYEEIENLPFTKVDNYFPLKYEKDFNLLPSQTISQDRYRTAKTEQGFTKTRQRGVEKVPRTDFLAVLEEAVYDQQWYLHIQPELENIKYLVKSREYLEKGGEIATGFWKDYIDVVARRGWSATAKSNPMLRERRINLNNAILGYKLTTIVMQPMALFDGMAMAQTRYGSLATLKVLGEFTKSWIIPGKTKEIVSESMALQLRQGGEVAIAENFEKVKTGQGLYNKFKKGALKLIQEADLKTAAGVQEGIERALVDEGIPNAKEEAEFMMNLSQGSAEISQRPLILSSGEGARTWFTFQTFFLNRWGIIINDLIRGGVLSKNWKQVLNSLVGLGILVAGFIAEKEARKGLAKLTGGKPSEQSALVTALTSIPEQIPFFGNIISSFMATGEASLDAPLISVFEDTIQGGYQAITAKKTETRIRGAIKAAKGVAAIEFGIPGTFQIADILKNIFVPYDKNKGSSVPGELGKIRSRAGGLPGLGGSSLPKLPGL